MALALLATDAGAQDKAAGTKTHITHVHIFNGNSDRLTRGTKLLVEGNKSAKIAANIPSSAGVGS